MLIIASQAVPVAAEQGCGAAVTISSGTVNHAGTYGATATTAAGGTTNLTGPGASFGSMTMSAGFFNNGAVAGGNQPPCAKRSLLSVPS